ncbi:hypothetical protein RB195_021185 [Necator americanus]|uniref:BPTI/Kunitz inhibitor domain-containing protein n=1 Tax=Necator americanus TaxID=51031 RepID=A0ABR1EA35_NECAM
MVLPPITSTAFPMTFTFTTASTLPTPPPETLRSTTTTTTTELPTPPPETTPEISSTTRFLRPERKQMNKTKFFNPCPSGKPLMNEFNTPISCNYLNQPNGGCPEEYWCHTANRCEMRRDTGEGSELVARWYYDKHAKQCRRFLYKGIRGNANNFVTKTQCVDACETKWSNPCPTENFGPRRECSANSTECGVNQWCHLGGSDSTTVCCPGASSDPCSLPVETGEGGIELPRWYADPNDRSCSMQCKPFVYKGTKGNQNNFLTKAACEKQCKRECKSPCGSGEMLMTPTNEPRLCNPTSPCPQSHWCHVGITPEMTVCCSTLPNTCEMPLIKGHGNSYLTRWHFDSKQKKCIKFIYSGEGGNQNMFLTQDDCETICPVYENPCGSGKPLLVGNVPKVCNPSQRCPSTHFCHIGVDSDQNYCCPKNGDPCSQELAVGEGTYSLSRYYFDKETRRCREFTYQGSKGNANNFLNLEDCELVCPVLPNPCELGEPLLNALKEPIICGGEDSCINGYWCHVGGSPETTNCCPGTRRPCDLPLETGQGSETLERWFYDGGIQVEASLFLIKLDVSNDSENFQ